MTVYLANISRMLTVYELLGVKNQ